MEAVVETTVWNDSNLANHTYLFDGSKMVAYIKVGSTTPFYFKNPITIDKRGRKFVTVNPNPFKAVKERVQSLKCQVVKVISILLTPMKRLVHARDICIVEHVNT